MSDTSPPSVVFQAYNPATDEAPTGEATHCDGVPEDDDDDEGGDR